MGSCVCVFESGSFWPTSGTSFIRVLAIGKRKETKRNEKQPARSSRELIFKSTTWFSSNNKIKLFNFLPHLGSAARPLFDLLSALGIHFWSPSLMAYYNCDRLGRMVLQLQLLLLSPPKWLSMLMYRHRTPFCAFPPLLLLMKCRFVRRRNKKLVAGFEFPIRFCGILWTHYDKVVNVSVR